MKLLKKLVFILPLATIALASCEKDDDDNSGTNDGNFDRETMLSNMGNNIIIPKYQNFRDKTAPLHQAAKDFTADPTGQNLASLRSNFLEAYQAWQKVTPYGFGPAEDMVLRKNLNTFPADTQAIEKRIANNDQSWGPYDNDLKGFPALDYLLFKDPKQELVDSFRSGPNAQNRKAYLKAITNEINQKAKTVHNRWKSGGGNYLETFTNATGNDKGSSLSKVVNALNFNYEIIKNPKLGIPVGKKSLGDPLPKKVEAFYSEKSLDLMLRNLDAIENLFLGRYDGTNGKGLDDHLDAVDAKRDGQDLSDAIVDQFETARSELESLNRPLSEAIQNNKSAVEKAYEEVQKQVVLIKTDMPSALGVRITYQDNDGD